MGIELFNGILPIEVCFYAAQVDMTLCSILDDWYLFLKRWDYFTVSHVFTPFFTFFLLNFHIPGARKRALFASALLVWSLGWLFEMYEEIDTAWRFAVGSDSAVRHEYDPPDSLVGDPTAHMMGIALGVAFAVVTRQSPHMARHTNAPVRRVGDSMRWFALFMYVVEAFVYAYLGDLVMNVVVPSSKREDLYFERRIARYDWLAWAPSKVAIVIVCYMFNRFVLRDYRWLNGGDTVAYDATWAGLIVFTALCYVGVIWLWVQPQIVVLVTSATVLVLMLCTWWLYENVRRRQKLREQAYLRRRYSKYLEKHASVAFVHKHTVR